MQEALARLYLQDGRYLTSVRLPWARLPEVVVHENRVFVRRDDVYREAVGHSICSGGFREDGLPDLPS